MSPGAAGSARSAEAPHVIDQPLTPMEAALLRVLDTADAIEAGTLPAHLRPPTSPPAAVPTAAEERREAWPGRIAHVAKVWAVVAALGMVALNLAPAPARPKLAPPAPSLPAGGAHSAHPTSR